MMMEYPHRNLTIVVGDQPLKQVIPSPGLHLPNPFRRSYQVYVWVKESAEADTAEIRDLQGAIGVALSRQYRAQDAHTMQHAWCMSESGQGKAVSGIRVDERLGVAK